jgi:hypothetical protein
MPSTIAVFKDEYRDEHLGIKIKKGTQCSHTNREIIDANSGELLIEVYVPIDLKPIIRTVGFKERRKYKILWVPKSILNFSPDLQEDHKEVLGE